MCVGSVWQSFALLKDGFTSALPIESFPKGYQLVRVKGSSSLGAAVHAAKTSSLGIPFDADKHVEVFYERLS